MKHEGIAIIGMAAQLPSGSTSDQDFDYQSFWDFLVNGQKAYEPLETVFPQVVLDSQPVQLPTHGAFLKNAANFDNISFGISARDARVTPYSARRLMDLSFQALLDSGIESRGRNIGCFMSGNRALKGESSINADGSFSWMPYSMSNRISYALDLTGPSVSLDTACSSSLTAFHLAIGAIERGDCSAALVGAAQINRDVFEWTSYAQGGVLSPDGMSKPFNAVADGFGRGEGVIVVVLKPLKDAVRDNDHIYSVVVGSAINATGSRMPLNAPNGVAQQQCIREAYKRADLSLQDADYVELHATGTSVGDPIETNAAGSLFAKDVSAAFGSIKGNVGHLEVAAFLASVVKACLIFEHNIVPPTVNISCLSRTIEWDQFQAVVPVEPTELGCRSSAGRATISISGAGLGGATGHVILQAPPSPKQSISELSTTPVLFLIGGLSSNVVEQISKAALRMDPKEFRQYAVTLSRRARQLPWRTHFTVPLSSSADIPPAVLVPNEPSPIAFVFSGQGPQNFEMGRQLFAEYPIFRQTILELDDVYQRVRGVSLIRSTGLFARSSSPKVALPDFEWPVTITVSAIAMIQIALVDLFKSIGIVPDMMFGHSAGETAALYASGAGPKEMAMEIAIARGEAMSPTESAGVGMAMLGCDADRASSLIARVIPDAAGALEISCLNTPDSIVVSGTVLLLEELVALGKSEGLLAQRIRTMIAGHSSFMDPIKDDYLARMDDILARYPGPHSPRVPVFSTCRDEMFVETFSASYFWDNCRNAVQFSRAVSHSLPSSPVFLEISCHPVLSPSILAHGVSDARILCPMRRIALKKTPAVNETATFLDTLGRLSLLGINSLDLSGLYGFSALKSKLIDHPLTARVISSPKSLSQNLVTSTPNNNGILSTSNLMTNKLSHRDLAENVINGEPILPATGFIEILLEAGANFLWDVEFTSILSLAASTSLEIGLQRLDSTWSVTTGTASREREHARGCMDKSPPNNPTPAKNFSALWKSLPSLDLNDFYSSLKPLVNYGPRFQRVVRCHGGPSEAIAEIEGPTSEELAQGYLLHPVIMDACVHVMLHPGISNESPKDVVYLPSRLEYFVYYRRKYGTGNWFSRIRLRQWTPDSRYYDILVTDSHGLPLCEMRNLLVKKLTLAEPITVTRRFDSAFQPAAQTVNIPRFDKTFPQRADKAQIRLLYNTLDSLAASMISKSLEHDIIVGKDESRRRYLAFGRRAVENRKEIDLSPEVLENLRDTWPHHFEITSRIAAVHESVFETPKRAVDALYSDGLMDKFYSKKSQTSNVCLEATKAFSDVLASLRNSGKRSIRMLEVGAGTGLLTYHLIDELKQNPDLLAEYTVTDISYALVSNLARNISYRSVVPKAYDISKDPSAQGIHAESYDVVVALHVLHAAPNVNECLASLQNLLVPGGCLLIVELDGSAWRENPGSVWFDCIFGSFPEWFGFADGREHCALAPVSWKKQLEALDFADVQTCVEDGANGRDFFFVAQKSLSCSSAIDTSLIDVRYIYTYQFGKGTELQNWLSAHDATTPITIHILAMQGRDADAALGLCASLRKELPRWDIRLCIFESLAHISDHVPLISRHLWVFRNGDNVVLFDRDGVAHVSRIVLSPPPSKSASSVSAFGNTTFDDPNVIEVRVTQWAGISTLYDGFTGQANSSHHSGISAGDFVVGLAEISSAQTLRVPIGNVIPLTRNDAANLQYEIPCAILTSFIDALPVSSSDARIMFAVENRQLAAVLERRVSTMPWLEVVVTDFRDPELFQRVDILFSDSRTHAKYPHLRRLVPRSGQVILWDEFVKAEIGRDPSYIPGIWAQVRKTSPDTSTARNGVIKPMRSDSRRLDEPSSGSHAFPPFRDDRVYVLLDGLSVLGVDLAIWMYQHGARHLVLTSLDGLQCLEPAAKTMALVKLEYLKSQRDLEVQLELCDATDPKVMCSVIHSLSAPIAGCFLMATVPSSPSFFEQKNDTFKSEFKLKVFEVFSGLVDIKSLDFFVAISSIARLIGLPGQSSYASACTLLDGALASHSNTFSFLMPEVLEAVYSDRRNDVPLTKPTEASWVYLEDGLRKLDDSPFNQYIPDMDWKSLDAHFPLPAPFRHLISVKYHRPTHQKQSRHKEDLLSRVLDLLEVSAADFDFTQPLTIYGLDSISAAKLSSMLRPFASFSQIQLLGGATWSEIQKEFQSSSSTGDSDESSTLGDITLADDILLDILGVSPEDFSPDIPLSSYGLDSLGASRLATALKPFMTLTQMQLMGQTTWSELLQLADTSHDSVDHSAAQPLVEIFSGPGTPLIILPGANGSIAPFLGLRKHFRGPVWAMQITESTPLESLLGLAEFWKEQICEKRPHGPYRFAAYSASVLLGVALTKMMEDAGEEVLQLTFIENCPVLWTREESEALLRERTEAEFRDLSDESVLDMLRNDPSAGHVALSNYEAALRDLPEASPSSCSEVGITRTVMTLIFRFLREFYSPTGAKSFSTFIGPFTTWLFSVKAPLLVLVAEHGVVHSIPGGAWPDLGASRFRNPVTAHHITGVGHFGLFADERVARMLEH